VAVAHIKSLITSNKHMKFLQYDAEHCHLVIIQYNSCSGQGIEIIQTNIK